MEAHIRRCAGNRYFQSALFSQQLEMKSKSLAKVTLQYTTDCMKSIVTHVPLTCTCSPAVADSRLGCRMVLTNPQCWGEALGPGHPDSTRGLS